MATKKSAKKKSPAWYDEKKLTRIRFAPGETGWAVDLGDCTYRLANNPIAAGCTHESYKDTARWGDHVRQGPTLTDHTGAAYSCLEVIARYDPETEQLTPVPPPPPKPKRKTKTNAKVSNNS